ncbi:ABC transporter permease [Laceyella putida]|uniref:ABC transporter permease n=1 Tax=Laceyella putida TaxID=110101 RepID=A0ABW2RQ83_9BACL
MNRWRKWWNNPVLEKEFQWRMRTKKTPWIIFFYLGITFGILFAVLALMQRDSSVLFEPSTSKWLFLGLGGIQLVMAAFVVPGVTAGLISGERERQTLPILLTTNLSSTQIVLSKWIASISFIVLLYILSLPIYLVVFMYGGISPEYVWKFVALYLVTILFYGSLGIFYSTLIKRSGVATVLSYVTVAIQGVGLLVVLYLVILYHSSAMAGSGSQQPLPWMVGVIAGIHPLLATAHVLYGKVDLFDLGNLNWDFFSIYLGTYVTLTVILLIGSIYYLAPVRFRWWFGKRKRRPEMEGEAG